MNAFRDRTSLCTAVFAALLLTSSHLFAAKLAVGDKMPVISAADQHGQPYAVEPTTEVVLVSFDMGTSQQANIYLDKRGPDYLPQHKAVYIANIHGMPGIGRTFAMPKMRKYRHRILLADTKGLLDNIPEEERKVTVITLGADGTVTAIAFWSPKTGEAPL